MDAEQGAQRREDLYDLVVPGTVLLQDNSARGDGEILLQPQPSSDPNDPLNWSNGRKYVNLAIVSFYTLMCYTILDIGPVVWQDYNYELGISYSDLNNSFAANNLGLAVGCILFMPFALKYGRRPVYIVSTAVTLGMAIWQAKLNSYSEMLAAQVIFGMSTSISETLVQLTIADIFFVHQRGLMYGIYLVLNNIGVFLAPVAAGYVATSQGWRWLFWWCTIFFAINLVLFIFCYEETKYTDTTIHGAAPVIDPADDLKREDSAAGPSGIDHSIPLKSYRERMAFTTNTKGPFSKFARHLWQPFVILFTFMIAAYCTITVGMCLAWFAIIATTEAQYFAAPPYNFTPVGIGLLNLPGFIGFLIGAIWGGPATDWFAIWKARRNGGVHEPEVRLWLAVFPVFVSFGGLLLYGYSLSAGMHWIVPCVGVALTMFGNSALSGVTLTYLSDSYREILGDALAVGAFVRNIIATIIVFVLTPWIEGMGLHDTFTCLACVSLGIGLLVVPMIIWGKRIRINCARRYARMAERQFTPRTI